LAERVRQISRHLLRRVHASTRSIPRPGPALVRVADANDIAEGAMRAFDVDGTKVNISHASGRFFAFDDTCTHAGCSLAAGTLNATIVTCACHGSQFDIADGSVVRGPAQRPVRSRRVEVRGSELMTEP
jgi:nitrite reductase/ring-hydroxylating ferredoxin subunit